MKDSWLPFLKKPPFSLTILQGKDVGNIKKFDNILNDSHQLIDEPCFSHLKGWNDQVIPRGLSLSWVGIEPDIYTFLRDRRDRSTIGYINAMPLTEEAFHGVCSGALVDNQITQDHLVAYDSKREHYLYLMSMAIKPAYRVSDLGLISRAFETLLNGLIDKLISYAQEQIRIKEIVAVGWTPEGKKLCRALDMADSGKEDKYGHPIFLLDIAKMVASDKPGAHSLRELLGMYKASASPQSRRAHAGL